MLFFVFEKLLFDFYVRKNQNILTFLNVMIKEYAKTPAPNGRFGASGGSGSPESLCKFGSFESFARRILIQIFDC